MRAPHWANAAPEVPVSNAGRRLRATVGEVAAENQRGRTTFRGSTLADIDRAESVVTRGRRLTSNFEWSPSTPEGEWPDQLYQMSARVDPRKRVSTALILGCHFADRWL